ncbi:MAG TPA: hypothetical protein VKT29_15510 [Terriglobales bacterium]|nr:hypothetical protein [Terriglobales bacterium]
MSFPRRQLLRMVSLGFGSSFVLSRNGLGMARQAATKTKKSATAGDAAQNELAQEAEKEKVAGIGGLFFRAHDPAALGRWYEQHLGITPTPTSYGGPVWQQEAGPTVFTAFPESTHYFGDPQKSWMVNFRVRNLDKMTAQLRAAGIEVKIDPLLSQRALCPAA